MKSPQKIVALCLGMLAFGSALARAELFSLSVSGTITGNSSLDTTIPIGTPWTFELIYDTAAPDLDFELTGTPDPAFGRFTNSGATPALTFFHYRAGSYEVTLDDPSDFGPFSEMLITFGGVHAIDINLNSSLFPPLAGGSARFHADFNSFALPPVTLTNDGLPTDTTIGLGGFQESTVTLLPATGGVVLGTQPSMTSLTIAAVPEPSTCALAMIGLSAFAGRRRRLER